MTKKELDAQANHLAEQQKKFVTTLYTLFDVVEGLEKYLKSYSAMLETQTALLEAVPGGAEFGWYGSARVHHQTP